MKHPVCRDLEPDLVAAAIGEAGAEAMELDGERCFLAGIVRIAERIGK